MNYLSRVSQSVFSAILLASLPCSARAGIVLDDPFNSFSLGTTWQSTGAGVPGDTLAYVFDGTNNYLHMGSVGAADEFRGIETITPISLVGVGSVVVDVRLRPINDGSGSSSAAEVAVLGASGKLSRALSSNAFAPGAWADSYVDSEGSNTKVDFAHCAFGGCDSYRRFVLTIDGTGTSLAVFNANESANGFSAFNPALTLADYGSEIDIALRQLQLSGGGTVRGFFDSVTVTTAAIPEPASAALLGLGAIGFTAMRRRVR